MGKFCQVLISCIDMIFSALGNGDRRIQTLNIPVPMYAPFRLRGRRYCYRLLTLFRAGGGAVRPHFRFFLCYGQTPQDIQFILGDFSNYSLRTFQQKKKLPGQVRSGHQSRFVDSTSEKFLITSNL